MAALTLIRSSAAPIARAAPAVRTFPRGKKGIVFIMIALLITGFLIVLFSGASRIPLDEDVAYNQARISTLNRFVDAFPGQVSIVMRSQGTRAFEGIARTLYDNHSSVVSIEDAFATCTVNGTVVVAGYPGAQACAGMQNQTVPFVLDSLVAMAGHAINANITYSIGHVALSQTGPFEVQLDYTVNYAVVDPLASWNKSFPLRTRLDITGILDPAYAGTLGTTGYRIKRTAIQSWNTTNLASFLSNHEYRTDPNGTRFLDRYTRTYVASPCCGIEAVVDPAIATAQNRSYVDRKFFVGTLYDCSVPERMRYTINDPLFNPSFQLDVEAVIVYGVYNKSQRAC